MKELLSLILTHITQHPKDVVIEESSREGYIILQAKVHHDDMSRVIGRQGSVIKAIRNVLKVRAVKENVRFSFELKESV